MRGTIFTALFFALFALFSTMAYAAPVAPQGTIVKRVCMGPTCRDATSNPTGSNSNDRYTALLSLLSDIVSLISSSNNNNKGTSNDLALPINPVVTTLPSSAEAPAADPTGL